ncbi:hypothetical protein ACHAWF_001133, partial [Thalassiosira exigua]
MTGRRRRLLPPSSVALFLLAAVAVFGDVVGAFVSPVPRSSLRPLDRRAAAVAVGPPRGVVPSPARPSASVARNVAPRRVDARSEGDVVDGEADDEKDGTARAVLAGGILTVLALAAALASAVTSDLGLDLNLATLIDDPSASFDEILNSLETLDPNRGVLYFGSFYVLAELLAVPAVPLLTASSGYLFGLIPGTVACLISASIAASLSFLVGKTVLRSYVEEALEGYPEFRAVDRAVGKEGFKLMLLLRLSPLFPFALSNYLYGASSVRFRPYFFGTLLGFAPGTFAYVYAGRIGKALTVDVATSEPWYVYAGGMAAVVLLLKVASDAASGMIESMEEEEEEEEEE